MRRAPIVLATTVAGTVGVLTFKPREVSFPAVASATASGAPDAATGSKSRRNRSSSVRTTPDSRTSKASVATATSAAARTATGDSIATQYGPVQVKVTVKAGKITNVVALALTGNDPKSAEISASAAPYLLQSALSKQTASIDAVSGATVTSAGYEASLQSALDTLGFKATDGSRGSSTVPQVQERGGFGH